MKDIKYRLDLLALALAHDRDEYLPWVFFSDKASLRSPFRIALVTMPMATSCLSAPCAPPRLMESASMISSVVRGSLLTISRAWILATERVIPQAGPRAPHSAMNSSLKSCSVSIPSSLTADPENISKYSEKPLHSIIFNIY